MPRRRFDLSRLVPPGYNGRRPLRILNVCWGFGVLYSWRILIRWQEILQSLRGNDGKLLPDAVMEDFAVLFRPVGRYFMTVAAAFLLIGLVSLWAFMRRGARSDYTLRCLPKRFEYVRRIVALPALGCLATLLLGFLLLLTWYAVYQMNTPPSIIAPGQWAKIWRL